MVEKKEKIKFEILLGIIILVIAAILYFDLTQYLSVEKIRGSILAYGNLAPIAYMALYIIVTVFFLPGSPVTIAGGIIFGKGYGTLYTVIGATIGATLAFLFARYFGRGFVEEKIKKKFKKLYSYNEKLEKKGLRVMLFLRFIPLFPFNGLNFALGLTKVRFRDYFIGTFFGIIPGTFVFSYFGDSIASLSWINIAISVGLLVLLMSTMKIYDYVKERKEGKK